MSLISDVLESPLDLSITDFAEPGKGLLVATAKMTQGRMAGVIVCALVAFVMAFAAWRISRDNWFDALWPWGFLSPFFGVIAVLGAFGRQQKTFDVPAHVAIVTAGIGPLNFERRVALPEKGVIRVLFRRVQGSRAGGKGTPSTRYYDLDVAGLPELGFTVAVDRDAARAAAARLSAALQYTIQDEAEDDGVERVKP